METKIISVGHTKGGVGKSVVTLLLARGLNELFGKKVLVLDCDFQGSLIGIYTNDMEFNGKTESEMPISLIYTSPDTLFNALEKHYGDYDFIFIDMPRMTDIKDEKVISYYYNTNFILVPVMDGATDLLSLNDFLGILESIREERNAQGVDFQYYGFANKALSTATYRDLPGQAEQFGLPFFESSLKRLDRISNIGFFGNLFRNQVGTMNLIPFVNEFYSKLTTGGNNNGTEK